MRVAFDCRADKIVEVAPAVEGRPPHGYVVAEVTPNPATVKVRGAERVVAALSTVRTREIRRSTSTPTPSTPTSILVPPDGVELLGPSHASVHVAIDEQLVTRKFPGLPVVVRSATPDDAAKWTVTPAQIEVTLTGALLAVEKARVAMTPVVKLAAGETKAREAEVVLEGLPPGIGATISPSA